MPPIKYTVRSISCPTALQPDRELYTVFADGKPVKAGFASVTLAKRFIDHLKGKKHEHDI